MRLHKTHLCLLITVFAYKVVPRNALMLCLLQNVLATQAKIGRFILYSFSCCWGRLSESEGGLGWSPFCLSSERMKKHTGRSPQRSEESALGQSGYEDAKRSAKGGKVVG